MRIAYNPKTSGPLPQAPGNNDITFDLAAKVIYARGTAFDGKAYKTFKKHDYDDDSGGWDGLVPAPSYSTANVRLLREDGQWVHIAGISSPDQELDEESINSVENKVITKKINELIALIGTKAVDVYKNIKVGNTTIVAKGVNDTLEFILGDGIMLVPNNKTISISINATGDLGIDVSYENGQLITKITKSYFDSWNETFDWYKSITDENTNEYIDKWQEIVDFLDELKKTDGNILDLFVTIHTDLIITGKKIFNNFLYLNDTKKYIRHTGGNSGYLEIFNETNIFSGLGLWDNGTVKIYTNSKWHDVIHSGNIGDQSVGTADKLKNKVKIWGLDFDGSNDVNGWISLPNTVGIYGTDTEGNKNHILLYSDSNVVNVGGGSAVRGHDTRIFGNNIYFAYSSDRTDGLILKSDGQITIAKSIFSGNSAFGQGRLELSGTTPFIDFHFNESTADYTSRIIEESSGELTCKGRWKVGGSLTASSNLSVAGSTTLKSMSATTGSFSGQITSTVADDTAPFLVASTTKVANLNADLLDGFHVNTGSEGKCFGKIPVISTDGVTELGHYIDWHYDNTTVKDYSTRLQVSGNHGNIVNLPSISGTLALTSQIGNGTVTIKLAGTTKGSFTMNQSGDTIIELTDNNTWRGITDSYTGTDTAISLSQKGANNLYKALLNGYASSAGDSTKWGGYNIVVGSAGTDANTIYFVL